MSEQDVRIDKLEKEIVNGKNTDMHIDKSVYAIHLTNIREVF